MANTVFFRMCRGELSLFITFWVWMVFGSALWGAAWGYFEASINQQFGFPFELAVSIVRTYGKDIFIYFIYALVALNFLYFLCVWHGVFRSSESYTGSRKWATAAKVIVMISAAMNIKLLSNAVNP